MSSVVTKVGKSTAAAEAKAAAKAVKDAEKAAAKVQKAAAKAQKDAAKAAAKAEKAEAKAATKAEKEKMDKEMNKIAEAAATRDLIPSDIVIFSAKASRANNDAINKLRERILLRALNSPTEFIADLVHGAAWKTLSDKFNIYLKKLCAEPYASVTMALKAGRGYHYDADITYRNASGEIVTTQKLEFKYGASTIGKLPQFLSLQACNPVVITGTTYDCYYYTHFIDKYIAADAGITVLKPERAEYLALVKNTNEGCHPFFTQIKSRENTNKAAKNKVVNDSIAAYLEAHVGNIDIIALTTKFRETQLGKHYALWSGDAFHYDYISNAELTGLEFDSISKAGNTVVLRAGTLCKYKLLLRWRNHKGILNPAWQIAMQRTR